MKMHELFVATLAILLAAGVSLSQQSAPTPEAVEAAPPADTTSSSSAQVEMRTVIVATKYYPVGDLAGLVTNLAEDEIRVITDERSRRLILTGEPERIAHVLDVIKQLDVPSPDEPQNQSMTCRVFMFELPTRNQNLKPFSLLLEQSSQTPSSKVLSAAMNVNVQISTLIQREEDDKPDLIIEGRAASNDDLNQVLAMIPDSRVKALKWDDEMFTADLPAAQISRLPGQLQEHVHKFLGDEVQTVGYWFGNLSVPGDLNAPIGPWRLQMKTQSGQGDNLVLEVRVTRESPIPFVNETQLFSNTLEGKAGRPVIVGYNRDSYGARVMGAMVVLLEPDTTDAPTTQTR